jgi:hypothetical protein
MPRKDLDAFLTREDNWVLGNRILPVRDTAEQVPRPHNFNRNFGRGIRMTRFLSFAGMLLLRALLFVGMASALEAQTITTFDPPGSTNTMSNAINLEGQVTGWSGSHPDGFLREPDGTFITFDAGGVPPNTYPNDINSAGQIVGSYFIDIDIESFLREPDGTIIYFRPTLPNEASPRVLPQNGFGCTPFGDSEAVAVNDVGQITGDFGGQGGCHGFLRQRDGTIITFDVPSESHPNEIPVAHPQAINLLAQITGNYTEDDVVIQIGGFLRLPCGSIVRFFAPNSTETIPTSINLFGQIAGYYQDTNSVVHGFLRQPNGTIITFDPTGSTHTEANSINLLGEITGFYLGRDGTHHGFLRKRNGTLTTFDPPSSRGTFAKSINLAGQITGYYFDGSSYHGFIRSKR